MVLGYLEKGVGGHKNGPRNEAVPLAVSCELRLAGAIIAAQGNLRRRWLGLWWRTHDTPIDQDCAENS